MHTELISRALRERFAELCGVRIQQLAPDRFGDAASYVSEVRELFHSSAPVVVGPSAHGAPDTWTEAETDCLPSLRALSLGRALKLRPAATPLPVDPFLTALSAARDEPQRRFQLLAKRYSCPLNFSLPAEEAAREHVLARLMVQDRARIEKRGSGGVNSDDMLLKLNLTALHASHASDLRFLDALNYYYELLSAEWQPQAGHDWLLVSYLALYARSLATWIG